VGRLVSGLFDLGTLLLVFKIGQRIFGRPIGLLGSFLYSIAVLPIQLAHFFAVDTFLVFFLTLSFYLLVFFVTRRHQKTNLSAKTLWPSILLGIFFGLALACKISAVLLLPVILLGHLLIWLKEDHRILSVTSLFLIITFGYLFFRLADPRIFADNNLLNPTLNPQYLSNLKELKALSSPDSLYPPSVHWLNTKPLIFPLKSIIFPGLGPLTSILVVGGLFYLLWQIFKDAVRSMVKDRLSIRLISQQERGTTLILAWIFLLFFYQGTQFTKALRYFYPLYPFFSILAGAFLWRCLLTIKQKINKESWLMVISLVAFGLLLWPVSFMSIYTRPHSRVMASQWIYENIPSGSIISCEHWDDCLPLTIGENSHQLYQVETLTLYDPDTLEKWQKTNQQLKKVDYLILSSNRLWGAIPEVPERYPISAKFYEDLLAERLNFKKVAEINSYPTVPILNLPIADDWVEESFTVYDHPKVLIFQKKSSLFSN
jgi:4-amino-4-deoxy-L-arabinose transferase-like glycosyltransferase